MHTTILGPREHHNARDLSSYRRAHAAAIALKRSRGWRIAVHRSDVPAAARVDAGSWLIDCECGAGNAVDPDARVAFCFGCGAIHEAVAFPPPGELAAIERLLLARPRQMHRAWRPGETTDDLAAENRSLEVAS